MLLFVLILSGSIKLLMGNLFRVYSMIYHLFQLRFVFVFLKMLNPIPVWLYQLPFTRKSALSSLV